MNTNKALPPLNALRAFEAAARFESLTKAALELGVTQAAVSQQVKLLEEYLGVPLFRRQARRLHLTDAARAYLPVLTAAFSSLMDGTSELFGANGQSLIRARVANSFAQLWLAPRLGRFYARHPEFRVRLLAATWPSQHSIEGADLEISNGYGNWTGMQVERLTREHWIVVASPDFLARHPLEEDPEQLLRLPLISVQGYRENWQTWFRELGIEQASPTPVLETDTSSLAIAAACSGLGLLLVRSFLVGAALRDGTLVEALPRHLATAGGHYLVLPTGALPSPKVTAFCRWIKDELKAEGELAKP